MTSRLIRSAVAVALCAGVVHFCLLAQDDEGGAGRFGDQRRTAGRSSIDLVAFEPHYFGIDSNSVRVDVLFRVRYDFFVFTRDISTTSPAFRARGELMVELIDSTDTSVSRKVVAILLRSQNDEPTQLRSFYFQGAASFTVRPGRYTALYRISDLESQREFADRRDLLRVPRFAPGAALRSTLLFVDPPAGPDTAKTFDAVNDGNSAQFSRNTGVFIAVRDVGGLPSLTYLLMRMDRSEKEREVVLPDTAAAVVLYRHKIPALVPAEPGDAPVRYTFDSSSTLSTVYFVMHTDQLKQGQYAARIRLGGSDTASFSRDFGVRWRDMPLALTDLDFAVTALKYITTDEEYDDLRSGNRSARIKKFEDFWAKRDPSHETAYNEMMAEYYRRVDYAFTAFRTLKEDNGVLTDRGKIYILYGKPSSIERSLAPGGPPRELWRYLSLKKEFTFEDPSRQGNYKLTAAETR